MSGKLSFIALAFIALLLALNAPLALSAPWTWSNTQVLTLFYAACVGIGIGGWVSIWLRRGTGGIKGRWNGAPPHVKLLSRKFYSWSLVFWIAVAIGLVVFFNIVDGRP